MPEAGNVQPSFSMMWFTSYELFSYAKPMLTAPLGTVMHWPAAVDAMKPT